MTNYVKINKPFPMIEAGYKMFTGVILNQSQADLVNRISEKCNYEYENYDGKVWETRLNERHRIVYDIAMGRR